MAAGGREAGGGEGGREGGNEEGPERDLRDQRPNPRPTSLSHVRVRMGRLKDFFKTYPSKYDTEAGAETESRDKGRIGQVAYVILECPWIPEPLFIPLPDPERNTTRNHTKPRREEEENARQSCS